jgi:hypothetical protein
MEGFAIVALDAQTHGVHLGEIGLRLAVVLLGGAPVPAGSLRRVGRYAEAVLVQQPEVELRVAVALLGERPPFAQRAGAAAASASRRQARARLSKRSMGIKLILRKITPERTPTC